MCLRTFDQHTAIGLIALMLVPLLVWNVIVARGLRFPLALQGTAIISILAVAYFVDEPLLLRTVPPLIGLSFTLNFFISLVRGRPLVESFARMQKPELSPQEVTYCRRATWYWVAVLASNTMMVTAAIFLNQTWQWLVAAAPASYFLIGFAFVSEYVYRKHRFREFDMGKPWDRMLHRLMGGAR
ncbi:MAG: hypothetical protein JRG91_18820 [Deltaproteobacteria bacterium]|nr:hypothetical protein [Deltaproteobacteria bacterium]